MRTHYKAIDEYIKSFPADVQVILQTIRRIVREAAPEAVEAISYGIPTFKLGGNLVHFSAYKHHIGFYPTPSGIEQFEAELATYKSSKGAVQFPLDRPVPYDLVKRIVIFQVKEKTGEKH